MMRGVSACVQGGWTDHGHGVLTKRIQMPGILRDNSWKFMGLGEGGEDQVRTNACGTLEESLDWRVAGEAASVVSVASA
jgi:hypothetical protein